MSSSNAGPMETGDTVSPAVTAETPMGLALGWQWTNWGMAGAQHGLLIPWGQVGPALLLCPDPG